MFDLSGKTTLITGAAGNLGRTTAQLFRDAGSRLVLSDLKEDSLYELYAQWQDSPDILLVPANLNDEHSVQALAAQAISHFGRIDVLANIAGGFKMGPPLHETSLEDWNFMIDMNASSIFLTSRAVIPAMLRQGGGRIISVSARAAKQGKPNMGPYCASKAAVITLTETLAAEHKFDSININCILPGTIDTPQNRESMPNADFSTWVPTTDLANVILFLASDEARAITGAAIPVYGRS